MEQMRYNLLFRWFVGLAIEDAVWDHSVFSKNRDRLLEHEVVEAFFTEVMSLADKQGLLSREHFSVDGTLIQAWASHKSFRPKDGLDDPPAGAGAMSTPTGRASGAATTRMNRVPIRMRACSERDGKAEPSFVIRGTS